MSEDMKQSSSHMPLLPLRDVVVYPYMVIPLFVGRERSIHALEAAMGGDKKLLLAAQKDAAIDDPDSTDIYKVGTIANILQLLKLPDGTVKVLIEGVQRANILSHIESSDSYMVEVSPIAEDAGDERETEILSRSLLGQFEKYVKLNKKIPPEILASLSGIESTERLADTIAAHLSIKILKKQEILELIDPRERIERLISNLAEEIDLLQVERRIRGRVKRQMEKSQREYYLNEQMKAIQRELGDMEDTPSEFEELEKKIAASGMPKDVREKADGELGKLKMMSPMSAEATVVRNYIDCLVGVPWQKKTRVRNNLGKAEEILEEDHYGLEQVKQRIIEYLAVQQRVKKLKGPILCLVGPPGVGKTSVGQSIARATNRKFTRMSLGGVRDEAEIRGHRRTYIGALPGRIVQNLSKVGVKNPLFLLDEVDKMAMDFRGDPSSALLEVLDPEQNNSFNDHYLEVDYDLSDVMFVATANTLNIPAPLLDRMEVIRLPGYTEEEKTSIASRYLSKKQFKNNGLKESEIRLSKNALKHIVRHYTREAGVRNLEREIAKISRKVVRELVSDSDRKSVHVTPRNISKYLGVERYQYGQVEEEDRIGQVTGLAWTEVGGELLTIEAVTVPGKGRSAYTGRLGDVMQESIQAAITVVRNRTELLGIDADFFQKSDIHIHVPEGATPKDGPSAGVGMCTALISALTRIPARADVAMTGEITLRGEVLAIGGLKEKLLAALRGGIREVLIPEENVRDLVEIPNKIKQNLSITPVKWIDDVLALALQKTPQALKKELADKDLPEGSSGSGSHDDGSVIRH